MYLLIKWLGKRLGLKLLGLEVRSIHVKLVVYFNLIQAINPYQLSVSRDLLPNAIRRVVCVYKDVLVLKEDAQIGVELIYQLSVSQVKENASGPGRELLRRCEKGHACLWIPVS